MDFCPGRPAVWLQILATNGASSVALVRILRAWMVIIGLLVTAQVSGEVVVESAWSRATVPGATTGVIYATLANQGPDAVTITGAASESARMVMIHETTMVDGVMKMRHRDEIVVPPGGRLEMAPGGVHIMLMGLKNRLQQGETVTAQIIVGEGQKINLSATIGSIGQLEAP